MDWGSRVVLAVDGRGAAGLVVRGHRLLRCVAAPLAPGVLEPGPLERNVRSPPALDAALGRLRAALPARAATLHLPHGVAWLDLLEVPAATDVAAFVSFRLGAQLPYPVAEANLGWLDMGRRRVLAAAVRRDVVEEYERAAAGAGFEVERVDLAPLAAAEAWLRSAAPACRIDVAFGQTAWFAAVFDRASLQLVRSRRRATGDTPGQVAEELQRTVAMAGLVDMPEVRVAGADAPALAAALRGIGLSAQLAWEPSSPEWAEAQLAWWEAQP